MGLRPFTEASQAFFFGRDEEIRDMFLRVREHTLTVLYGQSGLGKSSLLGAGLVPKLKVEGYSPVVIKLDFTEAADSVVEQVHNGLPSDTRRNSKEGATLWEIFHQKKEDTDQESSPVIIFDQFEEIFTLGQSSEARKGSVESLLGELGDLVENRPPAAIAARFQDGGDFPRQFNYGDARVRVVFALREDYLSHLERWRHEIPSLMRNRMPLHLLNGPKALEAAVRPGEIGGEKLVSDSVGAQIVRFVAKKDQGTPLESIDAVPPLLSLVCSELNEARIVSASGTIITSDMVAKQGADILQDFYERAFVRFPDSIREYIEDRMVTQKGHRNPVAREDAEAELKDEGVSAPREVLDSLIDSRLLSAEVRGGTQRLELTHDVLTPLAKKSRSNRKRVKEASRIRRQRNRLAVYVGVVSIFAFLSTGFGWMAWQAKNYAEIAKTDANNALRKVESYQFTEGKDWLTRAKSAKRVGENFEAAMLAAKAIGFEGLGRDALFEHPHIDLISPLIRENRDPLVFQNALEDASSNFERASMPIWMHTVSSPYKESILSLAIDNRGEILATTAKGGTIRLWDVDSGDFITEIATDADRIEHLVFGFSDFGATNRIYGIADGRIIIGWTTRNAEEIFNVAEETKEKLLSLECSSKGQLAILTGEGKVILRNGESGSKENHMAISETEAECTALCFTSDGNDLILGFKNGDLARISTLQGGGKVKSTLVDNESYISNKEGDYEKTQLHVSGEMRLGISTEISDIGNGITCLDADQQGLVAAGTENGNILIWNSSEEEKLSILRGHKYPVKKTRFVNNGACLLSNNGVLLPIRIGEFRKWDINSEKTLWKRTLSSPDYLWVYSGNSGKVILSAGLEVDMWDLSEEATVHEFERSNKNDDSSKFTSLEYPSKKGIGAIAINKYMVEFLRSGDLFSLRNSTKGVGIYATVDGSAVTFLDHPGVEWMSRSGVDEFVTASNESIRHWHLDNFSLISEVPTPRTDFDVTGLSPNGSYLARKDRGGVRIYDTRLGTEKFFLQNGMIKGNGIWEVTFDRDERFALAIGIEKTAIVWDLKSATRASSEISFDDFVTSSVFHPNGGTFATGTANGEVTFWNISGQEIESFRPSKSRIVSMTFSNDGSRLLIGTKSGESSIWSDSGQILQAFPQINPSPVYNTFHPDSRSVLERSGENTLYWAAPPEPEYTVDSITWVDGSSDGQQIVTGDTKGNISISSAQNPNEMTKWCGHDDSITWVEYSPDGSLIATASFDQTAKIWNARKHTLVAELIGHTATLMTSTFHPFRPLLATCSFDGMIKIWNTKNGELLRDIKTDRGEIHSMVFSPDGTSLAAGFGNGDIAIWNPETGSFRRSLESHKLNVVSMQFSADSDTLASLDYGGTARIWNIQSSDPVGVWTHCRGGAFNLDFDPKSSDLFIAGAGGQIYRWKFTSPESEILATTIAHDTVGISCLTVNPSRNELHYGTFGGNCGSISLRQGSNKSGLPTHFQKSSSPIDILLRDFFSFDGNKLIASTGSKDNLWRGKVRGPLNFASKTPLAARKTKPWISDPKSNLASAIARYDVTAALEWWNKIDSSLQNDSRISKTYWSFLLDTITSEVNAPRSRILMKNVLENQNSEPLKADKYEDWLGNVLSELSTQKNSLLHGVTLEQITLAVSLCSNPELRARYTNSIQQLGQNPQSKQPE